MPRYDWVLLDADNTLFDFDRAEDAALRRTLSHYGFPDLEGARQRYLTINRSLWARFDRGEIGQKWLLSERFAALGREFGVNYDPSEANDFYLSALGEGAWLLPGAEALCHALAGQCTLAIVTNGVARAQRKRFEASPLRAVIPHLFISEELGYQKPQREYFDSVLQALAVSHRGRAVVVGDSLRADIQGAVNAHLSSIWYAPGAPTEPCPTPPPDGPQPTWVARSHAEIADLILG